MLLLPEEMRNEVRKRFGKVLTGEELFAGLKKAGRPIIAVGDQCAHDLITNGMPPEIMIFDFKIQRKEISKEMKQDFAPNAKTALVVLSAPAMITDELVAAVCEVLGKGKGAIFVAGEDDLSALVVMANAKGGTLVYGQPNDGAVVVQLGSEEVREKAGGIMKRMARV